jgi:hypothetical protein
LPNGRHDSETRAILTTISVPTCLLLSFIPSSAHGGTTKAVGSIDALEADLYRWHGELPNWKGAFRLNCGTGKASQQQQRRNRVALSVVGIVSAEIAVVLVLILILILILILVS